MVNIKAIKRHNSNILNYCKANGNYDKYTGGLPEDWYSIEIYGIINSISKIFSAKKRIVKGYNTLVEQHNERVNDLNKVNHEIVETNAAIKCFEKLREDLAEQSKKMLKMCEKVYKPENYDHCVWLYLERNKLLNLLGYYDDLSKKHHYAWSPAPLFLTIHSTSHSTDTGSSTPSSDNNTSDTSSGVGCSYSPRYWSGHRQELSEAERLDALNRLEEIEGEIAKQDNYEYNLNLRDLYKDYDSMNEHCHHTINKWNKKLTKRVERLEKNKTNKLKRISRLKKFIDIEQEILESCNVDLQSSKINKLNKVDSTVDSKKIDGSIALQWIFRKGSEYHLNLTKWIKTCNKYIDMFNVKYLEKSPLPKKSVEMTY